jgi:SAM-dependent methyltransferase
MASAGNFSDADAYELQMGRWSRGLAETFLDFTGPTEGARVLDVGCGTGSLTFALARRNKTVGITGMDLTPVFIERARATSRDPRLEFRVGDATELPFHDASFDHALSLLCLHFTSPVEKAIAEMRRVTKPGGTVAAAVWDARGGFVSMRMFWDTAAVLDPKANEARSKHFLRPMCRPGEFERAWRTAGLVDIQPSTVATRMEFKDFADYWAPFLGKQAPAAAYVALLTPSEIDRLREAMKMAYLDGEADGPRSYVAIAWAVKGKVPA